MSWLFHNKWRNFKFFWKKWNLNLMLSRRCFFIKRRGYYKLPRKKYNKYILKANRWNIRSFRKKFLKKRWRKLRVWVKSIATKEEPLFFLYKRKHLWLNNIFSNIFRSNINFFLSTPWFEPYALRFRRRNPVKNFFLHKDIFYKSLFRYWKIKRLSKNISYSNIINNNDNVKKIHFLFAKRKFFGSRYNTLFLMHSPFFRVLKRKRKLVINKKLKYKYAKVSDKNNTFKCIFLKKTTNNMLITLTDSNCKPIFLASYGRAKIFTKKRRRSSEAFKDLTNFLITKLKDLKLRKTRIKIFFQSKIKRFLRNMFFYTLKKQRFKIFSITFVRVKSHNGLRKKKMRRI